MRRKLLFAAILANAVIMGVTVAQIRAGKDPVIQVPFTPQLERLIAPQFDWSRP